jgi:c-di-GMP-binding flagellar brake protein YcgR
MNARTSDISLGGCYLDTMNPFHEGTPLRVRITHHGQSIDANARVVHSRPNVGMGLRFEQVDSRQVPILDRWIEDLQTA